MEKFMEKIKSMDSMKKAVMVLSALLVIALASLIAVFIYVQSQQSLPPQLAQQPAQQPTQQLTEQELAAELAGLQAQLQELLADGVNLESTSLISDWQAEDIALAFLGYGTLSSSMLFLENNIYTFEVDIRHGYGRYMVYVNATNGSVVRMSRFEDAPIIVD